MLLPILTWAGCLSSLALAAPALPEQVVLSGDRMTPSPRPLVIWHGLGDTALSPGISNFINRTQEIHPGIYVHSVQVPEDGTEDDERKAGFWGNAVAQSLEGCEQIKAIDELKDGFDGIGFSQGGLFLRWYQQYCDGPPIHNLVTFGTPHYGISALIPCPTPPTLSCLLAARAARAGIYRPWAQEHLVQASYFRDTERLEEFWEINGWLRDMNGERPFGRGEDEGGQGKRGEGKGLGALDNLVAILFEDDHTVSPAQSSHFASYAPSNKSEIIPLHDQDLYKDDWIGIKSLEEKGGLQLEKCPGEHMEIGGEKGCGERMVRRWIGWEK